MKKWIKIMGLSVLTAGMLMGCSNNKNSSSVNTKDNGKEMTVTVFDDLANYQGVEKGWFAKIVQDKFHMKLKFIAPNVAGGGNTLFDARSAAGNLGDIIITGTGGGKAKRLAKSGLISDMQPYAKNCKYLTKYKTAVDEVNKAVDKKSGMWGIMGNVSSQKATAPSEPIDPQTAPFIRWDYYKKLGYPKVKTLEDLLPVLQKMQALARKENPGKKIYAISLFKDWDSTVMQNAVQPMYFYGKKEMGNVVYDSQTGKVESLLKTNGWYERDLRFLNKAYRMGLVDPESSTQNYDKTFTKYGNGEALFSLFSFLGGTAYNNAKNSKEGKGFKLLDIEDMKVSSQGATPNGLNTAIYLGSKAKNKSRIVKFINWLYSPEGAMANNGVVAGAAGPKGMTWTMKNGQPILTKFGKEALLEKAGKIKVPKKWGTGTFVDGYSAINLRTLLISDKDPQAGNYEYAYQTWPSVIKETSTKLDKDWTAHMDGAKTTMDYLLKNKKLAVAPGANYNAPDEDSQTETLRNQIGTKIANSSWKAVFAPTTNQFNKIFKNMQKESKELGSDKVMQKDKQYVADQQRQREKVIKETK